MLLMGQLKGTALIRPKNKSIKDGCCLTHNNTDKFGHYTISLNP